MKFEPDWVITSAIMRFLNLVFVDLLVESIIVRFSHRPYQVRGYGGYLQLGYDRLNSISFPTQGDRLTFEVQFGHENLFQRGDESNANFRTKYKLDWKGALNYRHQTLVGKLALETAQNEVDQLSGEPAELGGFLNLSGFS